MAYQNTPNSVTGHSPFFLLHGREMEIPNNDNLKARISSENPSQKRSLENLKGSLNLDNKLVEEANRKLHQNKKRLRPQSEDSPILGERFGSSQRTWIGTEIPHVMDRPV